MPCCQQHVPPQEHGQNRTFRQKRRHSIHGENTRQSPTPEDLTHDDAHIQR